MQPQRTFEGFLRRLPALSALTATCALALFTGCSKNETPITGSASAPPVSLQCVWKPGHTYQLRLELDQSTDIEPPNPLVSTIHRVDFEQVCLVTVTNAPGGQLRLDMEITALGMERSKAEMISTGFNSEQGGEFFDDLGYVPVLKKLVGGRLRFTLSPDGKVAKSEGISEWLERAFGNPTGVRPKRPSTTTRVLTTNAEGRVTTTVLRTPVPTAPAPPPDAAPAPVPPSSSVPSNVASTLRGFFTADLFKQLLEFPFLPSAPVRVGDQWKSQGDTPITGRGRPRYNADVKFAGWQRHLGTNCARLDVKGTLAQRVPTSKKDGTLLGTLWLDVEAQFPAAITLSKDAVFPSSSTSRAVDTNEVSNAAAPKRVRQHMAVYLVSITPPASETITSSATPP